MVSQAVLPNQKPFVVANDAREDTDSLRALLDQNGYLFFKGLADADLIRRVRHEVLRICRDAGWVDRDSPLDKGVWSGAPIPADFTPAYVEVYRRILKLPSFQQLPKGPVFMDIVGKILGDDVLVHPRMIGRIVPPAAVETPATPPHQDWHFIRGATETFTVWTPLGDCPRQLGGVAILAGSHRLPYQRHVPTPGIGGVGVHLEEQEQGEWHTTDYTVGDFVLFHSHTVHQGLPNHSGRYMRLSTDNRYQRAGDEIDPASLRPHGDIDFDD